MRTSLIHLAAFSLAAIVAGAAAPSAFAQAADPSSTNAPAAPKAPVARVAHSSTNQADVEKLHSVKILPFRGTIASVDKTAKTFTLKGPTHQVIGVTSQTKLTKDSKPAVFDDLADGVVVTGSKQQFGEKWDAKTVKINSGKSAAPSTPPSAPAAPAK